MKYLSPSIAPIGSYTPWPLGDEEAGRTGQTGAGPNGAGNGGEWWRTWTTPEAAAGTTGMFTDLIGAIRGTPTYPPGTYPPGTAPPTTFPWGTVLVLGGLLVGGYFLLKAMDKPKTVRANRGRRKSAPMMRPMRKNRMNPSRRRRARRYRRAA